MEKPSYFFELIGKALEDGESIASLEEKLDRNFGETCALLVLDTTGFTKVIQAQANGIAFFLAIIHQLRQVCLDIFRRNGVIACRAFADNVFAEFASVDAALESAFLLHRYFLEKPVFLLGNTDTFGVCIGIGYGRVFRTEIEGVYGYEMNLASKIGEDIAGSGETLLTQAAWQALTDQESRSVAERLVTIAGRELPVYSVTAGPSPGVS